MLKPAFAAIGILAAVGALGASAQQRVAAGPPAASTAAGKIVLTRAEIGRIKARLRLTPEQLQHWGPIEAALRAMAAHGAHGVAAASEPIVLDQAKLQRLVAVAMPLLTSLGAEQRREATALARSLGLGQLVASY